MAHGLTLPESREGPDETNRVAHQRGCVDPNPHLTEEHARAHSRPFHNCLSVKGLHSEQRAHRRTQHEHATLYQRKTQELKFTAYWAARHRRRKAVS